MRVVCAALVAAMILPALGPRRAGAATSPDGTVPPRVDAAISRGLAFLARQQGADGAFDPGGPRVATTGLGVLAFLSAGQTPDVGKYGLNLRSAIEWLVSRQASDGYFGAGDRGMYSHAISTLALAEAYGVETGAARRVRLHSALVRSVAIILAAQDAPKSAPVFVGGWRYERNSPDSDLSLPGWNVLALRAARDVGIVIPEANVQKAGEFVLRCLDPVSKGFGYQPGNAAQPGDTAIGLLCLDVLGVGAANEAATNAAKKYLLAHPVDPESAFAYYGTYYVAQAAFQHGGDAWATFGRTTLERVVRTQDKDGGWPQSKGGQEPGRVYATAMSVATLTAVYRLLPVFQR